jgi:uncharacterized protein (DUF2164 family)
LQRTYSGFYCRSGSVSGRRAQGAILAKIEFNKHEKDTIVSKIKGYFLSELDQDIAQFDAEFLLDFFSAEVGAYYYNRGLADAKAILEEKVETITDAFYEIEKPTDFSR